MEMVLILNIVIGKLYFNNSEIYEGEWENNKETNEGITFIS